MVLVIRIKMVVMIVMLTVTVIRRLVEMAMVIMMMRWW